MYIFSSCFYSRENWTVVRGRGCFCLFVFFFFYHFSTGFVPGRLSFSAEKRGVRRIQPAWLLTTLSCTTVPVRPGCAKDESKNTDPPRPANLKISKTITKKLEILGKCNNNNYTTECWFLSFHGSEGTLPTFRRRQMPCGPWAVGNGIWYDLYGRKDRCVMKIALSRRYSTGFLISTMIARDAACSCG